MSNPALRDSKVVLAVTGGIAAYKAVEVCRRLVDSGAHVIPLLTDGALRFVGEATFSALGSERARVSLFEDEDPIAHVTLGRLADLILVCPATARSLGSYAAGISDDLLGATLLATRAPVVVCPAMHAEMWEHPAVGDNLSLLRSRGVTVVWPEEGRLAGGDFGAGRLAGCDSIVSTVAEVIGADKSELRAKGGSMAGLRVLVTAGGTREPVDPVRYLGNRSSGKQGYAIAESAWARGAEVSVVATTSRPVPPGVEVELVETAEEMRQAVQRRRDADVVVMAAAVADFRPSRMSAEKIKRSGKPTTIPLEPTPDILAELAKTSPRGQTLVGFAAETQDLLGNAEAKLRSKGVDLLAANDVSAPGAGFGHDTNAVVMIDSRGGRASVPLSSKARVAEEILDRVLALRSQPECGEEPSNTLEGSDGGGRLPCVGTRPDRDLNLLVSHP